MLRGGKERSLSFKASASAAMSLVPRYMYEKTPSFYVWAGLVFTLLSEAFMHTEYGKEWACNAPVSLVSTCLYGEKKFQDEEIVVLSQILSHPVNTGYDPVNTTGQQVLECCGEKVRNVKHLVALVESCESDFVTVLLFNRRQVVLMRDAAKAATAEVLEQHNIASDRSADIV